MSTRGRGGKFTKPKRGGGKHFSRDLQPLNADGEVMGMWGEPQPKVEEESEEEDSEEESSDDENKPPKQELTREERRAAAKARKAAAIARQQTKVAEPGDLPSDSSSSEEEEDDDMPANPNHTAKARSQAAKPTTPVSADKPAAKKSSANVDVSQLSRREREALQAQQAKERYDKLHAEGKTEQAKADLQRLKEVRERREAEAARKKAEAEEKAEHEKEKKAQMERENRRREQAAAKAARLGKGKKKA